MKRKPKPVKPRKETHEPVQRKKDKQEEKKVTKVVEIEVKVPEKAVEEPLKQPVVDLKFATEQQKKEAGVCACRGCANPIHIKNVCRTCGKALQLC